MAANIITLGVNYDHPSKSAKAKLGLPNWRFIQMQKLCKATFQRGKRKGNTPLGLAGLDDIPTWSQVLDSLLGESALESQAA